MKDMNIDRTVKCLKGFIVCNDNSRLYKTSKMVTNVNRPVEIKSKTTIFTLNTFMYFIYLKKMLR